MIFCSNAIINYNYIQVGQLDTVNCSYNNGSYNYGIRVYDAKEIKGDTVICYNYYAGYGIYARVRYQDQVIENNYIRLFNRYDWSSTQWAIYVYSNQQNNYYPRSTIKNNVIDVWNFGKGIRGGYSDIEGNTITGSWISLNSPCYWNMYYS